MSSLCLVAGDVGVRLATALLTLSWTHSIEKVEWRETWRAVPAGLELVEARVKGSGAGMEPGEDARLVGGWWVWRPERPAVAEVVLARSGVTADWRVCVEGTCRPVGEILGPAADGVAARLVACDR
ncbi:MAG: DUF1850 domain-containing protein [Siculibacillus sp.]|nr:DUF1850 domain-containing protein [Siculibacillus sp.]